MGAKCCKPTYTPNVEDYQSEAGDYRELSFFPLLFSLAEDQELKLNIPETLTFGFGMVPCLLKTNTESGKLEFSKKLSE